MYSRYLDLKKVFKDKSIFLLGPRQTGKTTLIKNSLKDYAYIDLLKSEVYLELKTNPERIRNKINDKEKYVVIDEIQRVPELLNEVHYLIENYDVKFLLTGSSARKLRKKGVNLLGGRARNYNLHPLTSQELAEDFKLERAINIGTLPSIVQSNDSQADLCAYVENYLQLEIAQEALVRNLPAFSRFLEVSALSNTQVINYARIASDAQIAPSTTQEYFRILYDTFMAYELPAWKAGKKRKVATTSKFYFFDIGVVNAILRRWKVFENSSDYGHCLESYIFSELTAYTNYNKLEPLCHWRTKLKEEVDFIFNQSIAIELKSKKKISNRDLTGLKKIKLEKIFKRHLLVANVSSKEFHENIEIWPILDFLKSLWQGEFL